MKFLQTKKIFMIILVLAFFVRFYKLGEIPLSMDWDENSNAYNAYSILKTGRDEYGTFLPITNRSFDDYKPPLYMYLNIPTVAIFGLTPFAARLPSAIFGFLTIPLIYFLTKKLFENARNPAANQKHDPSTSLRTRGGSRGGVPASAELTKQDQSSAPSTESTSTSGPPKASLAFSGEETTDRTPTNLLRRAFFDGGEVAKTPAQIIALLAAFFLAVSPWHIQFSRVGFEATVGLFTAVAAVTFFLYGLNNKKLLIPSGFFLALSAYSYHSERIFVPLIFLAAFLIFKKEILKVSKKYLALFIVITVLLALPLVILIPPKVILQRFEVTTGRPRLEDIERSIKFIKQDQSAGISVGNIIHNRRFVIGQTYLGNYLSHFDFNFLFTKGDDNFRHHVGNMGMLYLFELPLLVYGIYQLIKKRSKASVFVLAWLAVAPVAATPATPNPHANRSLPQIISLEIITAYGLYTLLAKKFFAKALLVTIFILWMAISFVMYQENYWRHYPYDFAPFWQYGYKEAVLKSIVVKDQYAKINVDRSLEQAYAFWLFNTKYDPGTYQKEGSRYHFDKYYFDAKPPIERNELFISDAGHFPGSFEIIKTIYFPDGMEALKIGHPK